MLPTNNITLERILLHSRATSMFTPGIERTTPCCETGTPINENMSRAATALSACKNSTALLSANDGIGTIQRRKTSGNISVRAARVPKHTAKLAIHHSTNASMLSESCTSSGMSAALHFAKPAIKTATNNKAEPMRKSAWAIGFCDLQSNKIRPALTGSIRNRCVYSSLCSARENVRASACHPTASDTTQRKAKLRFDRTVVIGISLSNQNAGHVDRGGMLAAWTI